MGCRRDRAAGEADAQQCRGMHGQGDRGTQECTAIQTDAHRCTVRGEVLFWTRSDNILPRGTPLSGAAVSARGSGSGKIYLGGWALRAPFPTPPPREGGSKGRISFFHAFQTYSMTKPLGTVIVCPCPCYGHCVPRQVDARGSAGACSSADACLS